MNGIAIRETLASDTEQLLPLIESYWRHEGIVGYESVRLRRQLEEFLSTPAFGCGWLATRTEVAVGYLLCAFVYSFEHGGARSDLAARGCVCLQMQVADGNTRAQRFYTRLGFEQKSGYRLWVAPLQPHTSRMAD